MLKLFVGRLLVNEALFSKSLSGKLKREGFDVIRIESHDTGNGIPDMFIQGFGYDFWVELKSDPKLKPNLNKIKVDWRPGQQAWALNYYYMHVKYKQTLTLVKASEGYYIVPMIQHYKDNIVIDPIWVENIGEFKYLLIILTHNEQWLSKSGTYREAINAWMDYWFPDVDYDPEVLLPMINIDSDLDPDMFIMEQASILQDLNKL